jgi:lysophospholipase L1-like esterase
MPALLCKWPQVSALLILCACGNSPPEIPAGETPLKWLEDIEAFEAEALLEPVPLDAALFIGSSSIRRWDTLQEDMAPLPIIKRGFGGSRLFDSVYWADRLVLAHAPAVIVMFSGTNDIKGEEPKSAVRVKDLFEQFVRRIRRACCEAPIVYIAINPSMARIEHLDIVKETNRQIASFCERDSSLHFVDTATALLDEQGQPDSHWFLEDELHLNPAGYALWTERIKPLVARLLDAAR